MENRAGVEDGEWRLGGLLEATEAAQEREDGLLN